ncbi:MAG: class I SAM-dependent methyltransferase [Flavobacteriales bacterium]
MSSLETQAHSANDPMGKAIYDFSLGKTCAPILVHSPEFFDDCIDVPYLFRSFEDCPELEQMALKRAKGHILDVGCGAGPHLSYLIQHQKKALGIDISELAIKSLKEKGLPAECVSIFEFKPKEKFDTILLLMNGLGLAGTRAELPQFLETIKGLLSETGEVLVESCAMDYLFDNEKDAKAFSGEILYQMQYENCLGKPFYWLYLSFDELKTFAKQVGLKAECIYQTESSSYLARLWHT